MATWGEVRGTLERLLGAERISDEILRVRISLVDEQGGQAGAGEVTYSQSDVYVRREVMPSKDGVTPGIEFVAIDGLIGQVGETDLMNAIAQVGQLVHGGLTYAQGTESGPLSFGMRLPADLLDLSQDNPLFPLYLYHVGAAAEALRSELNSRNGRFAQRTAEMRETAWGAIRRLLLGDPTLSIERSNDKALIFSMPGPARRDRQLRMFTGLWERGDGEQSIILEYSLGDFAAIDMRRAATAAALTDGGVVYIDGGASIRVALHLTAATIATFATRLVELAQAAEAYLDGA
jgi:hypothetical protein